MSSGKSQTSTTQTSEVRNPWAPAQPMLKEILKGAKENYGDRLGQSLYAGQTYAGLDPLSQQALQTTAQRATDPGGGLAAARNMMGATVAGDYLSAGNPYMSGMINRTIQDTMPAINATFSRAGRTGSDAHGYGLARGLGDAIMPIAYQNYGQERQNQLNTAMQMPAIETADTQLMRGVGAEYEQQQQQAINEAMARYQYNQDQQSNALKEYMGFTAPIAGLGGSSSGTSTTTQQMPQASPLQQALGVGMMGASFLAAPYTGGASMGLSGASPFARMFGAANPMTSRWPY